MLISLHPQKGIEGLEFGSSQLAAENLFGEGTCKEHYDGEFTLKSLGYSDRALFLYFDGTDKLVGVVVDADSNFFSLLGHPLVEICGTPPSFRSVKIWLNANRLKIASRSYSLGCLNCRIEDTCISFVFEEGGDVAIQLWDPRAFKRKNLE